MVPRGRRRPRRPTPTARRRRSIAETVMDQFTRRAKVVSYPQGEVILRKGDLGDVFYFIRRGEVQVTDGTPVDSECQSETLCSMCQCMHSSV